MTEWPEPLSDMAQLVGEAVVRKATEALKNGGGDIFIEVCDGKIGFPKLTVREVGAVQR